MDNENYQHHVPFSKVISYIRIFSVLVCAKMHSTMEACWHVYMNMDEDVATSIHRTVINTQPT